MTVTPANATASVSWTAPSSDGGSPVTGYTVAATDTTTPADGGETCSWTTGPLTCTVTGLTNGDSYSFTVRATNAVGLGSSRPPRARSPRPPSPGPPGRDGHGRGCLGATSPGRLPSSDGGSPVTGYTVAATDATTPANGGQTASGRRSGHRERSDQR